MKRHLLPALLMIGTILFSQHIQANALPTPGSEAELLEIRNGEEVESDEPTGNTIEIVPEEPPTLVLLAIGIAVLVGIGQRSRIARYLGSPSF